MLNLDPDQENFWLGGYRDGKTKSWRWSDGSPYDFSNLIGGHGEGTGYERRGLNMRNWKGILDFWRRMTIKLQNSNKPKPKLAAVTDEVRQQRDLHDT